MDCEQAANLISRRIDGELANGELDGGGAAALDAHLAECAGCRATAEATQLQDAALVRAFAPRRGAAQAVADRVAAALAPGLVPARPRRNWRWVPLASAVAAGVVFAALTLGPRLWTGSTRPTGFATGGPAIAHVTLRTGEAFTCPSHAPDDWRPVAAGAALGEGARVRTGTSARLELALADGSQLRLNEGSEARLGGGPAVELTRGQLWSAVPPDARPLRVTVPPESEAARSGAAATVTPPGARADFSCSGHAAVLTAVQGSADVVDRRGSVTRVAAGESATVRDEAGPPSRAAADVLLTTRWLNDLLVLKGRDDPELLARTGELLSRIKSDAATRPAAATTHPAAPDAPEVPNQFEQLIRAQGDRWSEPIACYVQSPRSREDRTQRLTAARLLSDLAPPSVIPDLIDLLGDRDGEVRLHVVRALHRLTGQTLGQSPEQCALESGPSVIQTQKKWQAWWDQDKPRNTARGG